MRKILRGLLWIAGALALVGVILRLTVIDVWTVPDDPRLVAAVAPTLQGGDVVLVLTRGTPGFGDLVRCPDPDTPQAFVVGRIAGLAGDTVETQGASLIVDGKTYAGESACPNTKFFVPHPTTGADVELTCDVVEMGGGWHYRGSSNASQAASKTHTDVGAGMVYLVSDDRDFHDDSRDYGTLPEASCKTRIFFRLWGKGGWADDQHRLSYIH